MVRNTLVAASLLVVTTFPGCESCENPVPTAPSSVASISPENKGNTTNPISEIKEVAGDLFGSQVVSGIPARINGVELMSLRGWLANPYPWEYIPEESTVHPVPRLWTPYQRQTPFQIVEQNRQLQEFGSAADILEYNPNPSIGDHNHWLRTYFSSGWRPFFLLYEHVYGTRFNPPDGGSKNMSDPYNRKVFKEDVDFMFRNVIIPYQSRYVSVKYRAVIYLWSSVRMEGDFASLLEEVKKDYPVFFIGDGVWSKPTEAEHLARTKALDGFMEYTLGGQSSYVGAVQSYRRASFKWRQFLRELEAKTGKRYLFIPTFQAAFDDTKVIPKRSNPPMYARSREEVLYHAEMIRSGISGLYDTPPFAVHGELAEGAAVIESQCLPETIDKPGRFVGCGTARLQILKDYFGR